MQQENLDRLASFLKARGISGALLSSPWTTTWLTGYAQGIQTGPSPFEGGPILGWWRDGGLAFVCSDVDAPGLRASGAEVVEYVGYTYGTPLNVVADQAEALRRLLGAGSGRGWVVGVEYHFLPATIVPVTQDLLGDTTLVPVDKDLEPLRAVKTPEEITRLRAVLALCDQAQVDVRELIRPGISEIELWGQLEARLEIAAGARLPLHSDLLGGPRTVDMAGWAGPTSCRTATRCLQTSARDWTATGAISAACTSPGPHPRSSGASTQQCGTCYGGRWMRSAQG